jgi:hypothetical protein
MKKINLFGGQFPHSYRIDFELDRYVFHHFINDVFVSEETYNKELILSMKRSGKRHTFLSKYIKKTDKDNDKTDWVNDK